jgi:hypothetical protein
MWERHVEPTLVAGAVLRSRTLKLLGIGESLAEEALGELVRSTAPTVVTKAKNDGVHVRITDKDVDAATMDARIAQMEGVVRERLGQYIWGTDEDTLGAVIGRGLAARGWRLATAESLSGGDVARILAESPDSATWYARGFVRPSADVDELTQLLEDLRPAPEVRLVVPYGEQAAELRIWTPDRPRSATIKFGSPLEGRRRAMLAALDLLRRAVDQR